MLLLWMMAISAAIALPFYFGLRFVQPKLALREIRAAALAIFAAFFILTGTYAWAERHYPNYGETE